MESILSLLFDDLNILYVCVLGSARVCVCVLVALSACVCVR